MAGVTDAAFRQRLRRNGCRRLYTEMVSAAALHRGNRRTRGYLQVPDGGEDLGVQLFGAVPEELASAAELAQEAGFRHVDLNMGCPVRKVVRTGAGAALLNDLGRAEACLRGLRRVVRGILSVKIRAGWDEGSINFLEVGRLAEASGVDLVTFHPRTRAQGYGGRADWGMVRALAADLSVPVVGNGDVTSAREAAARLFESGCQGVMVGRAAQGAPWLFRQGERLAGGLEPGPAPEPWEIGRDLCMQLEDQVRWKGTAVATFEMRKFAAWGARGLPGAAEFRRRLQTAADVEALRREVEGYFGTAGGSPGGAARGRAEGRVGLAGIP
ncbi:MAG: tRNA-dihydrouridine synthase [Deferrisomatales bacterium]|nr:tRNA-dihydrouridine synthase [Deferrisomatales bacterium]